MNNTHPNLHHQFTHHSPFTILHHPKQHTSSLLLLSPPRFYCTLPFRPFTSLPQPAVKHPPHHPHATSKPPHIPICTPFLCFTITGITALVNLLCRISLVSFRLSNSKLIDLRFDSLPPSPPTALYLLANHHFYSLRPPSAGRLGASSFSFANGATGPFVIHFPHFSEFMDRLQ